MSADLGVLDYLLLSLAACGGGILNSVAGGGSFLTFPSLVVVGVAPVTANATSAVALWPGSVAGAVAYRAELEESRSVLARLSVVSALGGLLGALVLLRTSSATFVFVVPYLLLAAALVFTFGPRLTRALGGATTRPRPGVLSLLQFVIAFYGGYFGGGMGIVMLAAFSLLGMSDIHTMNALKTVLATLINFVACFAFVLAGAVAWRPGLVMVSAATLGGYYGARFARRIAPERVRAGVQCIAWVMTAYFFWKARH